MYISVHVPPCTFVHVHMHTQERFARAEVSDCTIRVFQSLTNKMVALCHVKQEHNKTFGDSGAYTTTLS